MQVLASDTNAVINHTIIVHTAFSISIFILCTFSLSASTMASIIYTVHYTIISFNCSYV